MIRHLLLQYTLKGFYKFITNSYERTFLRLAFRYGGKERYKEFKIKFLDYEFTIPDVRSFLWQFKEIFVEECYKFESSTPKPVIYDCGANVGMSCTYFNRLYINSKIKAFEADPQIVEILTRNLNSNNINNVEIINKAIWTHNDGIEIGIEGADGSSIFLEDNKIKVESLRLKDLLESEDRIDFLKLDIEGAELEVIEDCKENLYKVENLFIEYHSFLDHNQELDVILQILKYNDFRYFIKQPFDRNIPFINRINKNYPNMDLQLNIFAYKYK